MSDDPPPNQVSRWIDPQIRRVLINMVPKEIDRNTIRYYLRVALRLGIWKTLKPESRALLKALSIWRGVVKSRVLKELVTSIILQIESRTLRGRALIYGTLIALRQGLKDWLNSTQKLLCLGISYISNSPLFKYLNS